MKNFGVIFKNPVNGIKNFLEDWTLLPNFTAGKHKANKK
jgi:hypothetical protein